MSMETFSAGVSRVAVLKSILLESTDKFAVYEMQKEMVEFISVETLADSVLVLEELLGQQHGRNHVQRGLEITRHFVAKKANLFFLAPAEFQSKLLRIMSDTLSTFTEMDSLIVYEVIAISLKVAKLLNKNSTKNSDLVVQFVETFLSQNNRKFIDLLFSPMLKDFVQRKLQKFLWSIMECFIWTVHPTLDITVYTTAEVLYEALKCRDLKDTVIRSGYTDFIGHVDVIRNPDCGHVYDTVRIREWTYVCTCVIAVLKTKTDLNPLLPFLLNLDAEITKSLKSPNYYQFPWLPTIYGDQDDLWIKILMHLLDILSSACEYHTSLHTHFLQFVGTMGYDHLVLVDLLTSPETKFLEYLLKYLKFIANTWSVFVSSISVFSRTDLCKENETDSQDFTEQTEVMAEEQYSDMEESEICEEMLDPVYQDLVKEKSTRDGRAKLSHLKAEISMQVNTTALLEATEMSTKTLDVTTSYETCGSSALKLNSGTKNEKEHIENYSLSQDLKQPAAAHQNNFLECKNTNPINIKGPSGGLSLISTYDEDSDSSETCDVEIGNEIEEETNSGAKYTVCEMVDMKNTCARFTANATTEKRNDSARSKFDFSIDENTVIGKRNTMPETKTTESQAKRLIDRAVVHSECYKESTWTGVFKADEKSGAENHDMNSDKTDQDIDDDVSENDFDVNTACSKGTASNTNNETMQHSDVVENEILDKVMGMLIRVRLKLERLHASDLLPYNPDALVALLEVVESNYEEN